MLRLMPVSLCLSLMGAPVHASNNDESPLESSHVVLEEILTAHDAMAQRLPDEAVWIGFDAPWEAPAMYALGTEIAVPVSRRHLEDALWKGAPRNASENAAN